MRICKTEGCDRAIKDTLTFCEDHPCKLPDGCWLMIGCILIGVCCSILAAMYAFIKWCLV